MVTAVVAIALFGAFMALVVLGVMREVIALRSEVASLHQLITVPPLPEWWESNVIPSPLRALHARSTATDETPIVMVFVEGVCPTCRDLIAELSTLPDYERLRESVVFIVLPGAADSEKAITEPLDSLGFTWVEDLDNELRSAAGVYGTPSALMITQSKAIEYKPGVDTNWISEKFPQIRVSA